MCLKYLCNKCRIQQRYLLCFMVFLGLVNNYTTRNCLNIALTEMLVPNPVVGETTECPKVSKEVSKQTGTFEWKPQQTASVMSMFFPGYVIMHLPGGFLATIYGGKHVLGFGVILSAGLCALSPVAVDYGGYQTLCVIRFFMGLAQGPLFPAISTLLSKWVLKRERSRLASIVIAGAHIGTIICNVVSAYFISVTNTWKLVFYFWAVLATIWYFIYLAVCYSEPSQNPFISDEEKEELLAEIGEPAHHKIPWKMIICYKPVIALMVAEAGHGVILFFSIVNLPKYFKDVLKYNVIEIGVMTSLPNIGVWFCSLIFGAIADWCINNSYMEVITVRRTYSTIGSIMPSLILVMAGYSGCYRTLATSMFLIAMCFKGLFYPGIKVNPLDITKNFTGIVGAFTNAIASLSYFPVSYIIAWVAKDNLIRQWLVVFWMIFGFNVFTIIVYDIWASAERAHWDVVQGEDK